MGEIIALNKKIASVSIRAKFKLGDKIEFIFPDHQNDFSWQVTNIFDEENNSISFTKPNTTVNLYLPKKIHDHGIIRIKL